MTDGDEAFEQRVQALCGAGDYHTAAGAILSQLGPHVVRAIHARFRDDQRTGEVFSSFAEDLWLGLPGFRFQCPVRVWVFILARNAGSRQLAQEQRQRRAQVPLPQAEALHEQALRIRTATLLQLHTPREQRLARLRAELSPEDQELLTLRLDRELDFAQIALVTLGDAQADGVAVTREASRLRKRFQLLKERLQKRWKELASEGS